ncbi:ATP-binding protein [Streptomyces sp. Edi2]|uniref:ATP-binding protein n=1 Tax=Streptomyces sp. Edi2 TaxID=3162528 RepID=UPI003305FE56
MPATPFANGLSRSLRGTVLAGTERVLCHALGGSSRIRASRQLADRAAGRSSTRFGRRRRPPVLSMRAAIPAQLSEISVARHQLRDHLHGWNLDPVVDGAVTATSEVLANAVVHGCHTASDMVTMTACCFGSQLLITVEDSSHQRPRVRRAPYEAESGRGLELVRALADRWGVMPAQEGIGKRVWMVFDLHHQAGRAAS